jgi:hypothetical protein
MIGVICDLISGSAVSLKEYDIKALYDDHGVEYFTAMPFTAYDEDPESVEKKYPILFKLAKAFFVEMGLISREEAKDTDILDAEWDMDMQSDDFNTLLAAMKHMAGKIKGDGKVDKVNDQLEKIYTNTIGNDIEEDLDDVLAREDGVDILEESDDQDELTVWPWGDPNN